MTPIRVGAIVNLRNITAEGDLMSNTAVEELTNPAEAALMARGQRILQNVIRALPKRDQAKALSAPDDLRTLMEMIALAPIEENPETRVRLRGVIARRELLEQEGGVLNPSTVAEVFGISRQAVAVRRSSGKLLAVEGNRGYVYPAWQFDNHDLLPGFLEILEILSDSTSWTQFIFFLSKNDTIGGKRPLDLLRKGKIEAVRRAAQMHGVHGAI